MPSLEALCCGVPVVAPASGIFPELEKTTQAVKLFNPGDAADLAGALREVADDRASWFERGKAASRVIRERYSSEAAVRALEEAFEEAR